MGKEKSMSSMRIKTDDITKWLAKKIRSMINGRYKCIRGAEGILRIKGRRRDIEEEGIGGYWDNGKRKIGIPYIYCINPPGGIIFQPSARGGDYYREGDYFPMFF
jgi:hypothetical protein